MRVKPAGSQTVLVEVWPQQLRAKQGEAGSRERRKRRRKFMQGDFVEDQT